jgi:hypothetical protein
MYLKPCPLSVFGTGGVDRSKSLLSVDIYPYTDIAFLIDFL